MGTEETPPFFVYIDFYFIL